MNLRAKLTVVAAVCLMAATLRADPSPEAWRFLRVLDAFWTSLPASGLRSERFEASTLPPDLLKILTKYDWGGDEHRLPESFVGLRMDLNDDGHFEYFLVNPVGSGTGGPNYFVFSFTPKGWEIIADFQGWFCLVRSKGKWPTIVHCSRGGDEYYSKATLEFSGERYQTVSAERFERGAITKLSRKELERR